MTKTKRLAIKSVATLLIFAFSFSEVSYASIVNGPKIPSDPLLFQAPLQFSQLKEIHRGTKNTLILHIQDAHCNFSGQENLAKTLDDIMTRYPVSQVLVEGGSRDDTLTPIKKIAPPEVWKKVARHFLLEGKISGEEYLNLTSDRPMKILGIEDRELYLKSIRAYGDLADSRAEILDYLKLIQSSLEKLKNRLYPKELLEYEKSKKSTDQRMELLELIQKYPVSLNNFPNIQKLIDLKRKEKSIDFNLANLEQAALLQDLSSPKSLIGDRRADSRLKHSGMTAAQLAFLQSLFTTAKEKNISLEQYPNILRYAEYLKDFSDVDLDLLLDEMQKAEDQIYKHVLSTGPVDALLLRAIDRYVALLVTAYSIQMSTKEFDFFKANEPDFSTEAYLSWVNRKLVELGYIEDIVPAKDILEKGKKALEAFYESVRERDFAFVANTKRILSVNPSDKPQVVVLITGGYHTPHLKELFQKEGWSYAVITPIVTGETNQKRYEELLLEPVRPHKSSNNPEADFLRVKKKTEGARLAALMESEPRLNELLSSAASLAGTDALVIPTETENRTEEAIPQKAKFSLSSFFRNTFLTTTLFFGLIIASFQSLSGQLPTSEHLPKIEAEKKIDYSSALRANGHIRFFFLRHATVSDFEQIAKDLKAMIKTGSDLKKPVTLVEENSPTYPKKMIQRGLYGGRDPVAGKFLDRQYEEEVMQYIKDRKREEDFITSAKTFLNVDFSKEKNPFHRALYKLIQECAKQGLDLMVTHEFVSEEMRILALDQEIIEAGVAAKRWNHKFYFKRGDDYDEKRDRQNLPITVKYIREAFGNEENSIAFIRGAGHFFCFENMQKIYPGKVSYYISARDLKELKSVVQEMENFFEINGNTKEKKRVNKEDPDLNAPTLNPSLLYWATGGAVLTVFAGLGVWYYRKTKNKTRNSKKTNDQKSTAARLAQSAKNEELNKVINLWNQADGHLTSASDYLKQLESFISVTDVHNASNNLLKIYLEELGGDFTMIDIYYKLREKIIFLPMTQEYLEKMKQIDDEIQKILEKIKETRGRLDSVTKLDEAKKSAKDLREEIFNLQLSSMPLAVMATLPMKAFTDIPGLDTAPIIVNRINQFHDALAAASDVLFRLELYIGLLDLKNEAWKLDLKRLMEGFGDSPANPDEPSGARLAKKSPEIQNWEEVAAEGYSVKIVPSEMDPLGRPARLNVDVFSKDTSSAWRPTKQLVHLQINYEYKFYPNFPKPKPHGLFSSLIRFFFAHDSVPGPTEYREGRGMALLAHLLDPKKYGGFEIISNASFSFQDSFAKSGKFGFKPMTARRDGESFRKKIDDRITALKNRGVDRDIISGWKYSTLYGVVPLPASDVDSSGARLAAPVPEEIAIKADGAAGTKPVWGNIVLYDPETPEEILYKFKTKNIDTEIDFFQNIYSQALLEGFKDEENAENIKSYIEFLTHVIINEIENKPPGTILQNPVAKFIKRVKREKDRAEELKSISREADFLDVIPAGEGKKITLSADTLGLLLDRARNQALALTKLSDDTEDIDYLQQEALRQLTSAEKVIDELKQHYEGLLEDNQKIVEREKKKYANLVAGLKKHIDKLDEELKSPARESKRYTKTERERDLNLKKRAEGKRLISATANLKNLNESIDEQNYMNILQYLEDIKKTRLGKEKSKTIDVMADENESFTAFLYREYLLKVFYPLRRVARKKQIDGKANMLAAHDDTISFFRMLFEKLQLTQVDEISLPEMDTSEDVILMVPSGALDVLTLRKIWEKYGNKIKAIIATDATLATHWVIVSQGFAKAPVVALIQAAQMKEKLKRVSNGESAFITPFRESGEQGVRVFFRPKPERHAEFELESYRQKLLNQLFEADKNKKVSFAVNANTTSEDVVRAFHHGADAIGMLRTEVFSIDMERILDTLLLKLIKERMIVRHPDSHNFLEFYNQMREEYAKIFFDPSMNGKSIALRAFDIKPDKNPIFVRYLRQFFPNSTVPQEGFDFYHTDLGRVMLINQLAAIIAAYDVHLRDTERLSKRFSTRRLPAGLRFFFPEIKTKEDLEFIKGDILPEAMLLYRNKTRANKIQARRMQQRIKWGLMIETLEAVENRGDIVNDPLIGFVSVGTNDLTARILSKQKSEEYEEAVVVERDSPEWRDEFSKLQPSVLLALDKIAATLARYNKTHPKKKKELGICGEIAGTDKFSIFVLWLQKKYPEVPIYTSMSARRIPATKYFLEIFQKNGGNPDRFFTKFPEVNDGAIERWAKWLVEKTVGPEINPWIEEKRKEISGARLAGRIYTQDVRDEKYQAYIPTIIDFVTRFLEIAEKNHEDRTGDKILYHLHVENNPLAINLHSLPDETAIHLKTTHETGLYFDVLKGENSLVVPETRALLMDTPQAFVYDDERPVLFNVTDKEEIIAVYLPVNSNTFIKLEMIQGTGKDERLGVLGQSQDNFRARSSLVSDIQLGGRENDSAGARLAMIDADQYLRDSEKRYASEKRDEEEYIRKTDEFVNQIHVALGEGWKNVRRVIYPAGGWDDVTAVAFMKVFPDIEQFFIVDDFEGSSLNTEEIQDKWKANLKNEAKRLGLSDEIISKIEIIVKRENYYKLEDFFKDQRVAIPGLTVIIDKYPGRHSSMRNDEQYPVSILRDTQPGDLIFGMKGGSANDGTWESLRWEEAVAKKVAENLRMPFLYKYPQAQTWTIWRRSQEGGSAAARLAAKPIQETEIKNEEVLEKIGQDRVILILGPDDTTGPIRDKLVAIGFSDENIRRAATLESYTAGAPIVDVGLKINLIINLNHEGISKKRLAGILNIVDSDKWLTLNQNQRRNNIISSSTIAEWLLWAVHRQILQQEGNDKAMERKGEALDSLREILGINQNNPEEWKRPSLSFKDDEENGVHKYSVKKDGHLFLKVWLEADSNIRIQLGSEQKIETARSATDLAQILKQIKIPAQISATAEGETIVIHFISEILNRVTTYNNRGPKAGKVPPRGTNRNFKWNEPKDIAKGLTESINAAYDILSDLVPRLKKKGSPSTEQRKDPLEEEADTITRTILDAFSKKIETLVQQSTESVEIDVQELIGEYQEPIKEKRALSVIVGDKLDKGLRRILRTNGFKLDSVKFEEEGIYRFWPSNVKRTPGNDNSPEKGARLADSNEILASQPLLKELLRRHSLMKYSENDQQELEAAWRKFENAGYVKKVLTEKELDVLEMRKTVSLGKAGKSMALSRERIRQIEFVALYKLRQAFWKYLDGALTDADLIEIRERNNHLIYKNNKSLKLSMPEITVAAASNISYEDRRLRGYGFGLGSENYSAPAKEYQSLLKDVFLGWFPSSESRRAEMLAKALVSIRRNSLQQRKYFFKDPKDPDSILKYEVFDSRYFMEKVREEEKKYQSSAFSDDQINQLLYSRLIPFKWVEDLLNEKIPRSIIVALFHRSHNPLAKWEQKKIERDRLIAGGDLSRKEANYVVVRVNGMTPERWRNDYKPIREQLIRIYKFGPFTATELLIKRRAPLVYARRINETARKIHSLSEVALSSVMIRNYLIGRNLERNKKWLAETFSISPKQIKKVMAPLEDYYKKVEKSSENNDSLEKGARLAQSQETDQKLVFASKELNEEMVRRLDFQDIPYNRNNIVDDLMTLVPAHRRGPILMLIIEFIGNAAMRVFSFSFGKALLPDGRGNFVAHFAIRQPKINDFDWEKLKQNFEGYQEHGLDYLADLKRRAKDNAYTNRGGGLQHFAFYAKYNPALLIYTFDPGTHQLQTDLYFEISESGARLADSFGKPSAARLSSLEKLRDTVPFERQIKELAAFAPNKIFDLQFREQGVEKNARVSIISRAHSGANITFLTRNKPDAQWKVFDAVYLSEVKVVEGRLIGQRHHPKARILAQQVFGSRQVEKAVESFHNRDEASRQDFAQFYGTLTENKYVQWNIDISGYEGLAKEDLVQQVAGLIKEIEKLNAAKSAARLSVSIQWNKESELLREVGGIESTIATGGKRTIQIFLGNASQQLLRQATGASILMTTVPVIAGEIQVFNHAANLRREMIANLSNPETAINELRSVFNHKLGTDELPLVLRVRPGAILNDYQTRQLIAEALHAFTLDLFKEYLRIRSTTTAA